MSSILDGLPVGGTVTMDTAPLIYYLEDHPDFADRYAPVFDAAANGTLRIAVSAVTLAEVLAGPLKAGNEILAARYRAMLSPRIVPVTEEIAALAARFRAAYRLRLPNAIQVATAVVTGSVALVTRDADFSQVREIRVVS